MYKFTECGAKRNVVKLGKSSAILACLASGVVLSSGFSAAYAENLKGSFRGGAYAAWASAKAGPIATTLGRSANQPCPCLGTDGKLRSNTTDALAAGDDGEVLSADTSRSTSRADKSASKAEATNTSKASNLNLFEGLIRSDGVQAVATIDADEDGFDSSVEGSRFRNLVIAGEQIPDNVEPDTTRKLAGIGSVTLKKVRHSGDGEEESQVTVDMITINVERKNDFDLPIGSKIIVGHASAGFVRTPVDVAVGGEAYLSKANKRAGEDVENNIGKAAVIHIPCEGTDGETKTHNVNALEGQQLLASGEGKTTAIGGPTQDGSIARTTAQIDDLRSLGGLIKAESLKAVAEDVFKDGKRSSSTEGSVVKGLRIANVPVGDVTTPNVKLDLPGIGRVMVNEQEIPPEGSDKSVRINSVHVFVEEKNGLGLPVGAELVIGHADANADKE